MVKDAEWFACCLPEPSLRSRISAASWSFPGRGRAAEGQEKKGAGVSEVFLSSSSDRPRKARWVGFCWDPQASGLESTRTRSSENGSQSYHVVPMVYECSSGTTYMSHVLLTSFQSEDQPGGALHEDLLLSFEF